MKELADVKTGQPSSVPESNAGKPICSQSRPFPHRDRDRVVRVTAESLTRLMGLAGEALVQSHRFPPLG